MFKLVAVVVAFSLLLGCTGLSPNTRSEVQDQIDVRVEAALVAHKAELKKEQEKEQAAFREEVLNEAFYAGIIHLLVFIPFAKRGETLTDIDVHRVKCPTYSSKVCYGGHLSVMSPYSPEERKIPVLFYYAKGSWQVDHPEEALPPKAPGRSEGVTPFVL